MFPAFFVYLQQCNGSGRGATAYRALKIPVPSRTSWGENRAGYVSTSRIGHKAVNLVHAWLSGGIGRRARLKIWCPGRDVWVRVPPGLPHSRVAELVDAPRSGRGGRKPVRVRVPSRLRRSGEMVDTSGLSPGGPKGS